MSRCRCKAKEEPIFILGIGVDVERGEDVGSIVDGGAEGEEVLAAVSGEGEGVGGDGEGDDDASELGGGEEKGDEGHFELGSGNEKESVRFIMGGDDESDES